MHTTHVSSGGRYPVLRTIAILYLVGSVGILGIGVWRAVNVMVYGQDMGSDIFGVTTNLSGRLLAAACWLGTSLIGVLGMFAIAELIKLFIDIEHNTRMFAARAATVGTSSDVIVATDPATGVTAVMAAEPVDAKLGLVTTTTGNGTGGRLGQWLEGEETAEGALLRGH